jgi:hypothetical protein
MTVGISANVRTQKSAQTFYPKVDYI